MMNSREGWRRHALPTPKQMGETDRLTIAGRLIGAGLTRPAHQGSRSVRTPLSLSAIAIFIGDFVAYALATATGHTLLFKSDDFIHNDIRPALPPELGVP